MIIQYSLFTIYCVIYHLSSTIKNYSLHAQVPISTRPPLLSTTPHEENAHNAKPPKRLGHAKTSPPALQDPSEVGIKNTPICSKRTEKVGYAAKQNTIEANVRKRCEKNRPSSPARLGESIWYNNAQKRI
jgi:hypothetical protein